MYIIRYKRCLDDLTFVMIQYLPLTNPLPGPREHMTQNFRNMKHLCTLLNYEISIMHNNSPKSSILKWQRPHKINWQKVNKTT